jgi:GDP-L-fucose synthase
VEQWDRSAAVYVAGAQTVVGAALCRRLGDQGFRRVLAPEPEALDLADAPAVERFFADVRPRYVFMAAGRSGGIDANRRRPATLLRDNLLVASHVFEAARRHRARKLLYLASSCCYPRDCPQPMRVEALLSGPLEPTSDAYALAKLAGIWLCRSYRREHGADFVAAIPTQTFGPGDDFSLDDSHVVAGLIRRLHDAARAGASAVTLWGSGRARREFVYADDLAEACLLVAERYSAEAPVNLGGAGEVTIAELAEVVREAVRFDGELRWDHAHPDGMPAKTLAAPELAALGWTPRTPLREGVARTYRWFVERGARA